MRWHSRGGRSLFFAKIVTPSRVAGARATRVSQPIGASVRGVGGDVKEVGALVIRTASGYVPASHEPSCARRRSHLVILRIALAIWAACIYAVYWLGYLRGAL